MSGPTFVQIVQSDTGNNNISSEQTGAFGSANVAHNRIVVDIWWFFIGFNTAVIALSDLAGNIYTQLGTTDRVSDGESHATFECVDIKAFSGNKITASFTVELVGFVVIQASEVAGSSRTKPSYGQQFSWGPKSTSPGTLPLVTRVVNDMGVITGTYSDAYVPTGASTGCTLRGVITANDNVGWSERKASAAGALAVGFTTTGSDNAGLAGFIIPGPDLPAIATSSNA